MKKESRAISKGGGIETEYGVWSNDGQIEFAARRFLARCSRLSLPGMVCPYPHADGWSKLLGRGRETPPGRFTAGSEMHDSVIMPNGAFWHEDHRHLEDSTAFYEDPRAILVGNRANRLLLDRIRSAFEQRDQHYEFYCHNVASGDLYEVEPYTNGERRPRVSFGGHVNLITRADIPEQTLVDHLVPLFVELTPIIGAGKVGVDDKADTADFQISQRADFIKRVFDRDTMVHRGIYNDRDEPLAGPRFRRVHIICFDTNMLELPELIKIWAPAVVLMMLEDKVAPPPVKLAHPVAAFQAVSRDRAMTLPLEMSGKKSPRTALELLQEFRDAAADYILQYHPDDAVLGDGLQRFSDILKDCEEASRSGDRTILYGKLDWPTKELMIQRVLGKKQLSWQSNTAYYLDAEYHNNNHATGRFYRFVAGCGEEMRITRDDELEQAIMTAPPNRTAWTRRFLECVQDFTWTDYWHQYKPRSNGHWQGEAPFVHFDDPFVRYDARVADQIFSLGNPRAIVEALADAGIVTVMPPGERVRCAVARGQ